MNWSTWSPGNVLRSFVRFLSSYEGKGTLAYAYAYILLGLVIASLGPTLTHLAEQTSTDLADLGFLFPARSLIYVLGSAAGGPIFDRYPGHVVLWISMLGSLIGTALVPFCPNPWLLTACVGFQGLSSGILDTGGNVSLVWLWGDAVAPYMQLIHFAFGLGAFLCPLFVEMSIEITGTYKFSFWLCAFLYIPGIIAFMLLPSPRPSGGDGTVRKRTVMEIVLVVIGAVILGLYVGAEVSMGGYIYSYVVEFIGGSGSEGDYLTSAYWGALAIGRLVAIPVSMYVSARSMLITNMVFCAISSTLIWIFTGNVTVLWICTIVFGFSMGSTYPSTLNMLEKYVSLSGKITAVLVVGGALGEMLVPTVCAFIFRGGNNWSDLMVVLSIDSLMNLGLLALFIYLGRSVLANGYARMASTANDIQLTAMSSGADLLNGASSMHLEDMADGTDTGDEDLTEYADPSDSPNGWTQNGEYTTLTIEPETGLPLTVSRKSPQWTIS